MSHYASLNGERIVSGTITLPNRGVWTADLVLASELDVPSSVALQLGNLSLVGTRFRTLSYGGSRSIRVVGGAGGWSKDVPKKAYSSAAGVLLSTVLKDVAGEVGETVSLASDSTIGTKWTRFSGHASSVLDLLVPFWFVQPDGSTRIGARTSKKITSSFEVTNVSGSGGRVVVGTEDLASWLPANTFTSRTITTAQTISAVIHNIADGVIRTEAYVVDLAGTSTDDRLRDSLVAVINSVLKSQPFGLYEYVVVSQSGQKVSCRPTDTTLGLPELTDLPLRPGILGGEATLSPGSTVVIGFINRSLSRPEVLFASSTTAVAVGGSVLTAPAVVRVGDIISGLTSPSGPVTGTITVATPNPLPGAKLQ